MEWSTVLISLLVVAGIVVGVLFGVGIIKIGGGSSTKGPSNLFYSSPVLVYGPEGTVSNLNQYGKPNAAMLMCNKDPRCTGIGAFNAPATMFVPDETGRSRQVIADAWNLYGGSLVSNSSIGVSGTQTLPKGTATTPAPPVSFYSSPALMWSQDHQTPYGNQFGSAQPAQAACAADARCVGVGTFSGPLNRSFTDEFGNKTEISALEWNLFGGPLKPTTGLQEVILRPKPLA